jgi:HD-GYP domain-containing protein (c-di-GMP phosphodiesterase class II)
MVKFKFGNSIVKKLLFFFSLLIVVVMMTMFSTNRFLSKIESATQVIDYNYEIRNNIEGVENNLLSSKVLPSIEKITILNRDELEEKTRKNTIAIYELLDKIQLIVDDKEILDQYRYIREDYESLEENIINAKEYDGNTINLYKRYKEVIYNSLDNVTEKLEDSKNDSFDQMKKQIQFFVALMILIILLGIYIVNGEIFKPIIAITGFFKRNAQSYSFTEFEVRKRNEIGLLMENYNQLKHRLVTMESITRQISSKDSFEEIFDYIFESFKDFIPYDRIGIAVLNDDEKGITALRAKSNLPILLGSDYSEKLLNSSLSGVIEENEPRIINDLQEYLENKPESKSTEIIVREGMKSSLTLPLLVGSKCVGVVFFSSIKANSYNKNHINILNNVTNSLSVAFYKSFLQNDLVISTIVGFAKLVESKDNETGDHLGRMSQYSVLIAELMSSEGLYRGIINEEFIKQIGVYSQLHDIGKVGISDKVLLKPGKLTREEFEDMKRHTLIGAGILENMNSKLKSYNKQYYKLGIDITKYHHEKYDGSGYPEGISGEEIPLAARIVALGDVLDALSSPRPYKKAFSIEKSIEIIIEGRGNHFDPQIVDVFVNYQNKFIELHNYLWAKENFKK